ncbi:MAG TPA: pyridoxal phosphate-dependent aminotransferase family protein, partial [Armatimonadota bacterium]
MIQQMIRTAMRTLDNSGHYAIIKDITHSVDGGVIVHFDGHAYVNFASNSYLGLAQHPKVTEATIAAARTHGAGTGGSRLTSGAHDLHRQLEERIAAFKGHEDGVIFTTGYLANTGILPAITCCPIRGMITNLDPEASSAFTKVDIFADALVHASIIDGLAIATARIFGRQVQCHFYHHLDMAHLESLLTKSSAPSKLIVTDGVFSLHGRLAPLDRLAPLAERYEASLYVDDAHGTGVLGAHGRGTAEHFGVD